MKFVTDLLIRRMFIQADGLCSDELRGANIANGDRWLDGTSSGVSHERS